MYIQADNYVGYKLKLYPDPYQIQKIREYFGVCRFVYNLGISIQEDNYKKCIKENNDYSFLSFYELNNKLTELKNTEEFSWLQDYDSTTIKLILKDVRYAYERYFKGFNKHPKLKRKKFTTQSFPIRPERMTIEKDFIKIPGFKPIYCKYFNGKEECIGTGNKGNDILPHKKYVNPRLIYDGCEYYLSFSIEKSYEEGIEPNSCKRFKNNEIWQHKDYSEPIGIDLGCKQNNWIVDSKGNRIDKPSYFKEAKQVKKYSKKFTTKEKVNDKIFLGKKANSTIDQSKKVQRAYTKNEEKILRKLNKAYKRITNKKLAVIHDYACSIINEKPSSIIMEDLDVSNMIIHKSEDIYTMYKKMHNKIINESMLYTIRTIIERKAVANNIPIIYADREYPSSQLCSCCGSRQKIGLSRVYKCPVCGNEIDRDLNAAYNLSKLGYPDYNQYNYILA